jgi:hypothetical protein
MQTETSLLVVIPLLKSDHPHTTMTHHKNEHHSLECRILLDELSGHTNKSPEAILLDGERSMIGLSPAPRLDGKNLPREIIWVAIPDKVKVALGRIIHDGDLPIDRLTVDWLEAEVAEFNGAPAESIAADHDIITRGKGWRYCPEISAICTGFSFYP